LTVAGIEIGLFRLADGSFRAYQDYCPHAGAPLCNGEIRFEPDDAGTAGPAQPVLRCPWHGWDFNLATGTHVRLSSCRLEAFAVECQAGVIYICLPGTS
jgi:nitrite reductase (NADH) small subunit